MSDPHEYRDALPQGSVRGRGAQLNPGNRFEATRLHVLGEHLDEQLRETGGKPIQLRDTIIPDQSRTIINYVDPKTSPDIGFRWTINPYRGCSHGCSYCYARQTHELLGMSCGLDFETKIVAKLNAADLLRRELASPKWQGETIVMSGVTDCYQPAERDLKLTRQCLEVMVDCRQSVSMITKSRLVTRDIDLLSQLAGHNAAAVGVSITTLDNRIARAMEPRASSPRDRLDAVRTLAGAGLPVAVMVAPIVPGLTDREMPAILEAAAAAGATSAGYIMLRLPHQIKAVFLDWLAREFPDRAAKVETQIRDVREGGLYDPTAGVRQRGKGPVADQIAAMFDVFSKRYGLANRVMGDTPNRAGLNTAAFRKPSLDGQMSLFDA